MRSSRGSGAWRCSPPPGRRPAVVRGVAASAGPAPRGGGLAAEVRDAREPWRHTSVVAPVATGSISGFGGIGYELAVRAVAAKLQ